MPQPTLSQGHIDAVLSNISVAYMQQAAGMIAHQVFPVVPVDHKSDKYFVYDKNDWFRDEAKPRTDGTESAGSGYNLSTDDYNANVWAIHKDVGPQARANYSSPLDADRDAVRFVTNRMILRQEVQWVADYFTTSKWATDRTLVGTEQWNDYGFSNPAADIELAKRSILSTTGFEPNTLVVGYDVHAALKAHPDIKDQFKYTTSDNITNNTIAKYLEIDRYLVAKAIVATNQEGDTPAYEFTHGKHALLMYVNPSPSIMTPSAGYTFMWKGISKGIGTNIAINRIDMPWLGIGTTRFEGEIAYDNKLVAADMGYFIENAVA